MTALLPVEQPAKTAVRVETGETAPIDGPAPGDQGGRVAIADQSVIGDWRVSARN